MNSDLKVKLTMTKNIDALMKERNLGNEESSDESSDKSSSDESPSDSYIFKPSKDQRSHRAIFYVSIKGLGIDLSKLGVDLIDRYAPHACLRNWLELPGFLDWFKNAESHRYKVRMLLDKQLELLEEIQENREGIYSVRDILAAGKQILEYKKTFDDEEKDSKDTSTDEDTVRRIAAKLLDAKRLADKRHEDSQPRLELPS